jgi:cyclopropane-fatty-acyl-phospholipid synthase
MSVARLFELYLGGASRVALSAYDGSRSGAGDAVAELEVRSPEALTQILAAPGELGLARAYVTGALEVRGDLHDTMRRLSLRRSARRLTPRDRARIARELARVLRRGDLRVPPAPPEEAPPAWRRGLLRHTRARDAAAIAHHYDLSNRFYEIVLGPSMTYSCAVFPTPDATLEEAQAEKVDLVCRKLMLRPGERLLDIGAGWGAMVAHAAEHYGVRAVGVTISRGQAEWASAMLAARGLRDRAEVRLLDYRDVAEGGFDAICSIGMSEHVGARRLGAYARALASRLRPGGRLLNHCITRPSGHERARSGPFIDRYIFPDGELEPVGAVAAALYDHGLEVRHDESLREHYALTLRAWGANLERGWAGAVREVGERRARAWRLYMAAARLGFERNELQIHQVLAVRTGPDGRSGQPLRPGWERTGEPARRPSSDGRPAQAPLPSR